MLLRRHKQPLTEAVKEDKQPLTEAVKEEVKVEKPKKPKKGEGK